MHSQRGHSHHSFILHSPRTTRRKRRRPHGSRTCAHECVQVCNWPASRVGKRALAGTCRYTPTAARGRTMQGRRPCKGRQGPARERQLDVAGRGTLWKRTVRERQGFRSDCRLRCKPVLPAFTENQRGCTVEQSSSAELVRLSGEPAHLSAACLRVQQDQRGLHRRTLSSDGRPSCVDHMISRSITARQILASLKPAPFAQRLLSPRLPIPRTVRHFAPFTAQVDRSSAFTMGGSGDPYNVVRSDPRFPPSPWRRL